MKNQSLNQNKNIRDLNQDAIVTVIGAGVIGLSWAGLFLANGLQVIINDPKSDLVESSLAGLQSIIPSLKALGFVTDNLTERLSFEKDLAKAVEHADYIQENGPENIVFKQNLYLELEKYAPKKALMLSSSSSIPASVYSEKMANPSRVLVGHPFNPPHLIPLVEVVPGTNTSKDAIDDAVRFYRFMNKKAVVIDKEVPGFVANRLQAAIFRECVYLVKEGVVSIDSLDEIVSNSIGLRWAAAGPFKTFTLGGGPGGLPSFLAHFGQGLENLWSALGTASFDQETMEILTRQYSSTYGTIPHEELEKERDQQQLAIMAALNI